MCHLMLDLLCFSLFEGCVLLAERKVREFSESQNLVRADYNLKNLCQQVKEED